MYGLLRTADSVTPSLTGADVAISFVAYSVVYVLMFAAGVALMLRIVRRGPAGPEARPDVIESGRPLAPVEAMPRTGGRAMSGPALDFIPIWTLMLGVGVFLYVLLDGFDLGVGILYGFAPNRGARNLVMNSIAPIWDGNETWLVLGGVALLAAFPLAFAIILPAVYFPILTMLLALVFRGVAFEFRYRDAERRTFWDHAFCYGSALGAFAQGVVLGAFIQGFRDRRAPFRRRVRSTASRPSRC